MLIIGIDPGLAGGLAVLRHGECGGVYDLPTMAAGKTGRKMINAAAVAELLREIRVAYSGFSVAVALERPAAMPGQGVSSMFSLGDSFGALRGVVAALNLPLHLIVPAVWKRRFGLNADKEAARALAISLFPDAALARKKDHGRAEALLIAEFLRREIE